MSSATKPNVRESLASLHEMLRTGQSARAEPIARQLQLAYPHRGDVNHMMALILSSLGRPEQAEPYHARAVAADGRNTQLPAELRPLPAHAWAAWRRRRNTTSAPPRSNPESRS